MFWHFRKLPTAVRFSFYVAFRYGNDQGCGAIFVTNVTDNPSDPPWTAIREHKVRLEKPDVIVFKAQGDITVADVDQFIEIIRPWSIPEGGFFYLSDLTHLGHQSQQAVMRIRALPPNFIRATVVVGASFRHRVLLDVMVRTSRVLRLEVTRTLPLLAKSHEEAHALFDKHRRGEMTSG